MIAYQHQKSCYGITQPTVKVGDRRNTKLKTINWRLPNDNAQMWEAGRMDKLAMPSLH